MSEFFTPSRVVDILIALIMIWMILRYLKIGFIAGIVDLCGTLLAVGGAMWGSNALAPMLFEKIFRSNLISRTENALLNSEGVLSLNEVVNKISGFLPQNIIDTFMGDYSADTTFDLALPDIAGNIVDEVIQPLLMPVLSILIFFLIFIVCRIVVGFIASALKSVNKIPLVGTVNRVMGAASGLLVGSAYGYLIVCALWALAVITGGDVPFLQESALQESFFYGIFDSAIPFI